MKVECTECEFSKTFDRSAVEAADADVSTHAERTGHSLRVLPLEA